MGLHTSDLLVIGLTITLALVIQFILYRIRRNIEGVWGGDNPPKQAAPDPRPRIVVKQEDPIDPSP